VVVAYLADGGHTHVASGLVAIAASGAVCGVLWALLNTTRRQTSKAAEQTLAYGLRWLFNCHPELLDPRAPGPGPVG
jgi:hypothetical protein